MTRRNRATKRRDEAALDLLRRRRAVIWLLVLANPTTSYRSLGRLFGVTYETIRSLANKVDRDIRREIVAMTYAPSWPEPAWRRRLRTARALGESERGKLMHDWSGDLPPMEIGK